MAPFVDRADAGRRLARRLLGHRGEDLIVLGLPRGGVPVAFEVARALGAPLDVLVTRKLGVPWQPELGFGAVAPGGVRILNDVLLADEGLTEEQVEEVLARETEELERRVRAYRAGRPPLELRDRTVLLVDDGLATGYTARAAIEAARAEAARRIVLAVPVAPPETVRELRPHVDELVCLETPDNFRALGAWYDRFDQVGDEEVMAWLERASRESEGRPRTARVEAPPAGGGDARDVQIPAGSARLGGRLAVPGGARGIVLFAHGSGSGRDSPRNRAVARALHDAGVGTLLFDLLSPDEAALDAATARLGFDIPFLASRLAEATSWLREQPEARGLALGYFGSSTGAAAALVAAARSPEGIGAVVSRGGRPDLAAQELGAVRAPTLLIVGGDDAEVLRRNRAALGKLRCQKELRVVPGASHLFEEPGALELVARLASGWFARHLGRASRPARAALR